MLIHLVIGIGPGIRPGKPRMSCAAPHAATLLRLVVAAALLAACGAREEAGGEEAAEAAAAPMDPAQPPPLHHAPETHTLPADGEAIATNVLFEALRNDDRGALDARDVWMQSLPDLFAQTDEPHTPLCRADGWEHSDVQTGALDEHTNIVGFICSTGAYNFGYRYFAYTPEDIESSFRPLVFERCDAGGETRTRDELINTHLGEAAHTIEEYAKARGVGGCGTWSRHQWSDETGEFELTECRSISCTEADARMLEDGDDESMLNASTWPRIYPPAEFEPTE